MKGGLEVFLGGQVDLAGGFLVDAGEGGHGQALGGAGDEVELAALPAGPVHFAGHILGLPAGVVDGGAVHAAHEGDLAAVLLDQFRNIVGGHDALPDVNAHVDHVRHQGGGVGIGVVDNELHAVVLIILVDLHVAGLDELPEHLGGQEGGLLAAPVIVVEQGIGLNVGADLLGQVQLKLGDLVQDFVHFIGVLIEGHEAVLDLHQVVALLKHAGGDEGGAELLIPVHLFRGLDEGLPLLGAVDHVGHLQILLPFLHVLDDDLVRSVDGEGTGGTGGEGPGHAPGVDHVQLPGLGGGVVGGKGIAHLHGEGFILVDEAVRMAAVDGFQQVLTFG